MSKNPLEEKNKKQDIILKQQGDDKPLDLVEESKRNAYLWLFIGVLFFLVSLLLGAFAYQVINSSDKNGTNSLKSLSMQLSQKGQKPNLKGMTRRLLDGVYVEEGKENLYPIALMIDNHTDARPPAGLAQANLVFEAEAEGGVTRYLAVFSGEKLVDKIGPIRSARPYFIDWARELSALYAHVGGSPEALVYMKKDSVLHINEFYNGDYYWRDKNRPRPHNVFTSIENLRLYLGKKDLTEGKFLPWQFKDEKDEEARGVMNKIFIPFRTASYKVEWQYHKDRNSYTRYLSGLQQKDSSNNVIESKNVIIEVLRAKETDSKLRLKMENIGTGTALVCLDGFCYEAQWQKNSATARTRYYDDSGSELKLNAGTTWVEIVRPEIEYSYEGE